MTPGLDIEAEAVVDDGADGADLLGPFGQGRVGVQFGQGLGHALQQGGQPRHFAPPGLEGLAFHG
ncbi:hypothetical protein D3C86_2041810 [compost metagenome]